MTLDSCLLWLRRLRMARWHASLATAWRSSGKTRASRPVFLDRGSTSWMTPHNSNNIVIFSNPHIFLQFPRKPQPADADRLRPEPSRCSSNSSEDNRYRRVLLHSQRLELQVSPSLYVQVIQVLNQNVRCWRTALRKKKMDPLFWRSHGNHFLRGALSLRSRLSWRWRNGGFFFGSFLYLSVH